MTTTFKRGDTFLHVGQVMINGAIQDLTGWTIRAQIRAEDPNTELGTNALIQELVATIQTAATATIVVQATYTQTWPVGKAYLDIQLTSPAPESAKTSTPPLAIQIIAGVTHD